MTLVLDSYAFLVFLKKEKGNEKMEKIFADAANSGNNLLMSSVNFGEVYYILLRESGVEKADELEKLVDSLPVEIVNVGIDIAREAARFKAVHKISYADCFAAALAKIYKGEVITGDKEFKSLEKEIGIMWL